MEFMTLGFVNVDWFQLNQDHVQMQIFLNYVETIVPETTQVELVYIRNVLNEGDLYADSLQKKIASSMYLQTLKSEQIFVTLKYEHYAILFATCVTEYKILFFAGCKQYLIRRGCISI